MNQTLSSFIYQSIARTIIFMSFCILGIEGSANKLGLSIVTSTGEILSNVRHTFVSPIGVGFLPRETAQHHVAFIMPLLKQTVREAKVDKKQVLM